MAVREGLAVAYGGVPVGEYYGQGARVEGGDTWHGQQLTQSDLPDPHEDGTCDGMTSKGYPCGANPVRSGPYAGRKCAGHVKQAEKNTTQE